MDYTIFYKDRFTVEVLPETEYDVFLSAYDQSQRVGVLFDRITATDKYWLILSEYGFASSEHPRASGANVIVSPEADESEVVHDFFDKSGVDPAAARLGIDITGFMRPHIAFLMLFLMSRRVRQVDVYYSEPVQYAERERTAFAIGEMQGVRPVAGFEGQHDPEDPDVPAQREDLLILGVGYEHQLIRQVAEYKKSTRKVQVFGFPPLQADFYQENVINAAAAAQSLGRDADERAFAPASDPFVTASVIRSVVARERARRGVRGLYLSPLATRPQALGFSLYYLYECRGTATSILYPFPRRYRRAAAHGAGRVWRYSVELPLPDDGRA